MAVAAYRLLAKQIEQPAWVLLKAAVCAPAPNQISRWPRRIVVGWGIGDTISSLAADTYRRDRFCIISPCVFAFTGILSPAELFATEPMVRRGMSWNNALRNFCSVWMAA
jgi:hypothetical protein